MRIAYPAHDFHMMIEILKIIAPAYFYQVIGPDAVGGPEKVAVIVADDGREVVTRTVEVYRTGFPVIVCKNGAPGLFIRCKGVIGLGYDSGQFLPTDHISVILRKIIVFTIFPSMKILQGCALIKPDECIGFQNGQTDWDHEPGIYQDNKDQQVFQPGESFPEKPFDEESPENKQG
jgi:hypothetical protein